MNQLQSNNKMPFSKETMLLSFFNCPTSFHLLHIFFHTFSIQLAKFIHYVFLKSTFRSSDDGYEPSVEDPWCFSDFLRREEDLVDDIICDGKAASFMPLQTTKNKQVPVKDPDETPMTEHFPGHSRQESKSGHFTDYSTDEEPTVDDGDSVSLKTELDLGEECMEDGDSVSLKAEVGSDEEGLDDGDSVSLKAEVDSDEEVVDDGDFVSLETEVELDEEGLTSSIQMDQNKDVPITHNDTSEENVEADNQTIDTNISEDGKFFILEPKKLQFQETVMEENFQDLFTDESTSKSSSEWRSSLNCRDSGTEDPFSSSSRRSCPTWETCTLFRKYDEEMLFFDRFSAQKLSEADSFKAIQVRPRSVSQRIVHKLTTTRRTSESHRNPYHELETAYVSQICLTWEALNWNYKNFKRLQASQEEEEYGCPGKIAQQFQQFQVLLQRFIENEPYERGRRPEVYARMRNAAPQLLQVPEFIGSEDDNRKNGPNTMISSIKFLRIMEDAIRTFMNFLKEDKEKPCQIMKAFFKRKHRSLVDPFHLHLMKKTNKKKKRKLKDFYKAKKCFRKPKMKEEEVMEIVMCLIDLKVVSRVLRMSEIREQQLTWCEEKMNKVKVLEGKVQRDSSPLFFPNTLTHHHSMLLLDD